MDSELPRASARGIGLAAATVSLAVLIGALTLAGAAAASAPRQTGYATVDPACAAPQPGHVSCFALVRKPVSAAQAGRPGVQPFALRTGASAAGPAGGLTPAQLSSAYGYDPTVGGSGQTVAIVDAFDDPAIAHDLEEFDAQYGLPPCNEANGCFRKVGQTGRTSSLPSADTTGWSVEVSLDVEAVRAACRNCKILLVEAENTLFTNLAASENEAVALGATEVSNSYGGGEARAPAAESGYNHPGVVITAATGDGGYDSWAQGQLERPNMPAALPTVVAVGGTSLRLNGSDARASETVWERSGGGCSVFFAAEPWQLNAPGYPATGCGGKRLAADVAAVADPLTGFDIYDSYDCGPECEEFRDGANWLTIGGTSLSTPLISGLYALAGGSGGVSYPSATLYAHLGSGALFDVTEGGNGFCDEHGEACGINELFGELLDCEGTTACNAAPGYDGPSGVGTPNSLAAFQPEAPSAALSGPTVAGLGSAVTFSGAGSTDPVPGAHIVGYFWNWGDGSGSAGVTAVHAYGAPGVYTVTLTVADSFGLTAAASQAVTVAAPAPAPTGNASTGIASFKAVGPDAILAGTSLQVGANGSFTVKVSCPAGETSCKGTVTVQTAGAVVASARARVLTLAIASFRVAGGKIVAVRLHLGAKARALLARRHRLRVRVKITAHDSAGARHTSQALATLRAPKKHP